MQYLLDLTKYIGGKKKTKAEKLTLGSTIFSALFCDARKADSAMAASTLTGRS